MSLVCEISGELLGSVKAEDEIVVTPSGHVCIKRLLLTKLAENGGMDPFQPTGSNLPLSEDQLVTLQKPSSSSSTASAAPPRPQATSLPNLLSMMQQEYDALVLELFDTRKALEDTRRELSQALYQNDAAIRVVARLSQERDQARQELEQWNASVGPSTSAAAASAAAQAATNDTTPGAEGGEPDRKRRRVEALDPDAPPLQNDIPQSVYDDMDEAWKPLNAGRKAMLKAAASEAPTQEDLASYQDEDQKAWHKSSCKGVPAMSKSGSLIATAGKDKQVVVYHEVEQVVKDTFNFGTNATCVDVGPSLVVAGDAKGKITAYALTEDGSGDGLSATTKTDGNAAVVSVRVHPSQNQIVAGTAKGQILIYATALEEKRLQLVGTFVKDEADQFTCGELHPDGLLYAAGTKTGAVQIWDFRSKTLAFELKDESMEGDDPVTCIAISENGYTIAVSHASAVVRVWDVRKNKLATTMDDLFKSVDVVAFDKSGKYLAMGGDSGVKITTVKQWGTTASYETKKPISGVVWSKAGLETCSDKERSIHFFSSPSDS